MFEITESCLKGSQSSSSAAIEDTITMTCSISYRGSSVPVLQWSPGSSATDCSSISGTVCSSLTVNIQPGMTTVESQSCSVTFPSTVDVQLQQPCTRWTSTEITVSCMYVYNILITFSFITMHVSHAGETHRCFRALTPVCLCVTVCVCRHSNWRTASQKLIIVA